MILSPLKIQNNCLHFSYLYVGAFGDKLVGDSGDNAADDAGVKEGDISYPEHAEDQAEHEHGKVGLWSPICSFVIETRDVPDVDTGKFVLQNPREVADFLRELRRRGALQR